MALAMVHNHIVNVKAPKISAKIHKKLEEMPINYEKIKSAMAINFTVKDGKTIGF